MAIKGAIFDMDGTLLDSMHLWIDVAGRYLETLGISASPEERRTMGGMMLEEMAQYITDHFPTGRTPEETAAGINRVVEPGYRFSVQPKPDVPETLRRLQDRGVRLCVATATDRYLTEAALERTGLASYFGRIFTSPEEHKSKYGPDLFLTAGAWLGTPQESTYVFEDTYHSILGAKSAGYKVIAVHDKWSDRNRAQIIEAADLYVNTLGSLDLSQL